MVHHALYTHLGAFGIEQIIWVSLNPAQITDERDAEFQQNKNSTRVIRFQKLRKIHSLFFGGKIRAIFAAIEDRLSVEIDTIDIVHARFLAKDGSIAYLLWKKYRVPYIVEIRNTDINTYYRKLWWWRPFFNKVLLNASKIIFITTAYKNRVLQKVLPKNVRLAIESKVIIICSGVNDYFLDSRYEKTDIKTPTRLVCVGDINDNKNQIRVIKAITKIRKRKNIDIHFSMIGTMDTNYTSKVKSLMENNGRWLAVISPQSNREIVHVLRHYDMYVMPSIHEAFGLSYIEALSQGLPVVYTRNEGIDGLFEEGAVGYAVNPFDINDIAEKIEKTIMNYTLLASNISTLDLDMFKWENIVNTYMNVYKQIGKY
jgi:glycosyltransferase involved in cell wall biosynthesis